MGKKQNWIVWFGQLIKLLVTVSLSRSQKDTASSSVVYYIRDNSGLLLLSAVVSVTKLTILVAVHQGTSQTEHLMG